MVEGQNSDIILEFKNVTKEFPGVKALDDVSFAVQRGAVHVLCGENGAGKSTLMKIINGLYKVTSGMVFYNGEELKVSDPTQARQQGISMIYQELNIVPNMSIADNIYLGREIMKNYDLKSKMSTLSVAQAQMIEIIKSISCNAKVILMDEPTSALTGTEVEYLFGKIRELKESGVTIIYISHKMDEIFKIADYISVFRDGKHIATREAKEFTVNQIVELMVGREMSKVYPESHTTIGEEIFRVEGFNSKGKFKDINFSLREGEILGIAGLMGAGRTEIVRAIFGMDKKDSGRIFMKGEEIQIDEVKDAIKHGIDMLSEDRRKYGLITSRNMKENISLVALRHTYNKKWLDLKREQRDVTEIIERLNIKPHNMKAIVQNLSGGNQQKVVLGKWLLSQPKILILDEPTRGIDVGAKHEIYKIMRELTEQGVSVIMISSELPELLGMSDRVIVIRNGRISGELSKKELSPVSIMSFATGGDHEK